MIYKSKLRFGCSGLAVLVALWGLPVAAQNQAVVEDDENTIVVIGTGTNISGVKPVGSEAITLDREDILATGATTAADVVRTLPQVRNLGEYREGGTQASANSQQGNAINLRGLGVGATLTLVDGHRVVATGAAQNFTEANRVPMAALERIEVIADGASAVYGSDAIAGVVNYVLRKDYEGIEATMRVSNQGGGWEWSPGVTAGTSWEAGGLGRGNILVSYEYADRSAYLNGRSPYLRQDLSSFGGVDGRLNGATATAGLAPNITVPIPDNGQNATLPRAGANTYFGLPMGANDGLTAADLRLNDPNLIDSADYTDYAGSMKRHLLVAFLNQELTPGVELFVHGSYLKRDTYSRNFNTLVQNVTLPSVLYDEAGVPTAAPNPYYIAGVPGVAPGDPLNVQYNALKDVGPSNFDVGAETHSVTAGLRAELFAGWRGEIYYSYGRDDACNYCQTDLNVNPTALQYLINTGVINPLSSEPLSQAVISRFTGDNIQRSGNGMDDIVLKFDGPLFELPGGVAKAAFGGERNKTFNYNDNGANRNADNGFIFDTVGNQSRLGRTVWSAFGEVYLPLISEDLGIPLVQDLAVSAAVRHDDYSDVGSTTNPKIGFTWEVVDALSLRGSWGTSFRAPSLPDVNPFAFSAGGGPFPVSNSDPRIANGFLDLWFLPEPVTLANAGIVLGSNADLKPETATTWSLGADLDLGPVRASVTYYKITYEDRIQAPNAVIAAFTDENASSPDYGGYGAFILPINNPATCSNDDLSSADPLVQQYLGRTVLYGGISDFCSLNVLFDQRYTNLSATKQDGLDFSVNYGELWGDVFVTASASANVTLSYLEQIVAGSAFEDRLGYNFTPIKWRARGAVGASWQGLTSNLFLNYNGSYINEMAVNPQGDSIADVKIDPYVTFDLNLSYELNRLPFMAGLTDSTRLSVTVQNLFDKDPPLVITNGSVFNAAYSNPFGRTVSFQLTASF